MSLENTLSSQAATSLLLKREINPTPQRVEIAQLLFGKAQHVSADQIIDHIKQGGQKVSKATIYNTLGLFAKKELLREVIVDPSRIFYDTTTKAHSHFYHIDTGELIDIHPEQLAFQKFPSLPAGTVAEDVDVIIRIRSH